MAKITFTMKAPAEIISRLGIGKGQKVQKLIDTEVLKRSEPYIPKKSGDLINSGYEATDIGSGTVVYDTEYAAYQYYGVSVSGKALKYNGAPMRGSFWFERMKAAEGDTILNLAAEEAGAKAVHSSSLHKKQKYIPKNQKIKTAIGLRRNPVFR